jgi:hypothetical protein
MTTTARTPRGVPPTLMTFCCIGSRPSWIGFSLKWIGFSLKVSVSDPGLGGDSEASATYLWSVAQSELRRADAEGCINERLSDERVVRERAFFALLERAYSAQGARLQVGRTGLVVIRDATRPERQATLADRDAEIGACHQPVNC